MRDPLKLSDKLEFGFMCVVADPSSGQEVTQFAKSQGFESLWVGDHVAFAVPIHDSLSQLAFVAGFADGLTLGTSVFLLPLRHPVPVAKQIATLDTLSGGRFVFGVGVGGEFPKEYEACGVPVKERGARLGESIDVVRKLWTGDTVNHDGRFFQFSEVRMMPRPKQAGGPPIWCGGRAPAALARCGRLADGWMSYVVTPDMYAEGLGKIAEAAQSAGRKDIEFGTAHLLFARIGKDYDTALKPAAESLSERYAMDFTKATKRYAAIGTPDDVAEKMNSFIAAGVRHFIMDMVGPMQDRNDQLAWFAEEVRPKLKEF